MGLKGTLKIEAEVQRNRDRICVDKLDEENKACTQLDAVNPYRRAKSFVVKST